jgi:prevent-host-death family protein
MTLVNLYDAKARLSELVQRAGAGEEIVIAKNGRPVARLVPIQSEPRRAPGGWEGRVWIASDFDAADAELEALMLGDGERER